MEAGGLESHIRSRWGIVPVRGVGVLTPPVAVLAAAAAQYLFAPEVCRLRGRGKLGRPAQVRVLTLLPRVPWLQGPSMCHMELRVRTLPRLG